MADANASLKQSGAGGAGPLPGTAANATQPNAAGANQTSVPLTSLASNMAVGSKADLHGLGGSTKASQPVFNLATLEKRRGLLDARHRYILEKFGTLLPDVKPIELENSFLLGNKVELMNEFFREGGLKRCILTWTTVTKEEQRWMAVALGSSSTNANVNAVKNVLMVTDGTKEGLREGTSAFFLRTQNKAITPANILTDVSFGMLDARILPSLTSMVKSVLSPALSAQDQWGSLKATSSAASGAKEQPAEIEDFLGIMRGFVNDMDIAMINLRDSVQLHECTLNLEPYKKPSEFANAAHDGELINGLESLVQEWCKQIEQVLAASEQMRKEADDIGPSAELDHWKARMVKFNSITDQLKSPTCRRVIGILAVVKSKWLKQWKELDDRVTDAANESKDNVKYLYTLEKFFEPLYKNDPVTMIPAIPGLINAISLIYGISRYYNTSERMTSLFVKITNQMLTSCKTYIYQGGAKIWEQDRNVLGSRLQDCINLNTAYQNAFHDVKHKLQETPNERQFDFSEMYIFGKFDTFCKRLTKVMEMFGDIDKFAHLESLQIEGFEAIIKRFANLVSGIQRKPYDILDQRRNEYDTDFGNFKKQVADLETSVQTMIDNAFDRVTTTDGAIALLIKFAKVQNMELDLEAKHQQVFSLYLKRDLEGIRKLYQKYKDCPPIPRNQPPVSGAIAWARQLYKRVETPMLFFKDHTNVLDSAEAKKHIKNYNKLLKALVDFEILYYRAWCDIVDQARSGLQATVLVTNGEGQVFVNFDPQVVQLIKETRALQRLGFEIPDNALAVASQESEYKRAYLQLNYILQTKSRILHRLPHVLQAAVAPHVEALDLVLRPGLSVLTWTSLNLQAYITQSTTQLAHLEETVDKIADIVAVRIDAGTRRISEFAVCEVPADQETWTVETLHEKTEKRCAAVIAAINNRMALIEAATRDLFAELGKGVSEERRAALKPAYIAVYHHFHSQSMEALIECTRASLELLRTRLGLHSSSLNTTGAVATKPFFKAELVLSVPSVVLHPRVEDVQAALNKVTTLIVDVAKKVDPWHPFAPGDEVPKTEDAALLAQNKHISKIILQLSSSLNTIKKESEALKDSAARTEFLWKEDRDDVIKKFLASNPSILDFEHQINRLEYTERDVIEYPALKQIGALLVTSEPLKQSLIAEIKAWKHAYGLILNQKVKKDMEDLIEYMENKTSRLSRKIVDIDDLRGAVTTLAEVREQEMNIDMKLSPIEEAYQLLTKHGVSVTKEETEMVDTLNYTWKKVKTQVMDVQDNLAKLQPVFKSELVQNVRKYADDVDAFAKEYDLNGPMVNDIPPKTAIERLTIFQRSFDELARKWETYSAGEELFSLPVTPFPALLKIKKELKLLQSLYTLYSEVLEKKTKYNEWLMSEVDLALMNTEMQDMQNKIKKLPKAMKDWEAFNELKKTVDDLTAVIPLLEMMVNRAVLRRHWDQIMTVVGTKFDLEPDAFALRQVLEAPILKHYEEVEEICVAAVKEADIEVKLKLVVSEWQDKEFTFAAFKTRGNLVLKPSATSEIIASMEDGLMTLSSLMSNRYNAPFKAQIQTWVHNLSTASEIVENWLGVQNLWIYLEAVFVGGDIAKQLPREAKRFQNIDKSWCKIMGGANENPNVIQCCVADEQIANLLPHLTEQLELCQKSLSGYLEAKRAIFPRFYFVSDPALLEILGQASDTHTIQAHLKSVFDNVQAVKFHDKEYDKIIGMESSEGEYVPLSKAMVAAGNVEVWLGTLMGAMQTTINDIIRDAAKKMNELPLNKFLEDYPAQIGLLGIQMQWTQLCEDALNNSKTDKKKMATTMQKITDILNTLIDFTTREDISKMERVKYETLITIQVHHRDVFEKLQKSHIKSSDDFEWLKQARFYWRDTKDACIASITNFDFKYQCEYLGCTDRLVITPLTDRCYITLAQALGMSLGGSPAGPAGTGKTETTKDMGKALGKWVVVFNCSDQMDYRGLGRIFKGLAQAGCWGCFDEFNRIELPVLSVAAQQVGCVLSARKERKKNFVFTDGETVDLNPEVGYFITMNPGYAGRVELPENLKVHFRYVAMMVPDRQIIIRVKLAGAGFQQNIILAKKFFVLYRLCEEQLSKQVHYDFGLRNILSVLRTCGSVKRSNPQDSESMIIMRVLRDMNLSKLVDEDEPLFMSLINDLFPGLTAAKGSYPQLEQAIAQQVDEAGLINHPPWILKCIQLYETAKVRHGIMVLGPTGAGKTRCIHTLLKAMTACGEPHKEVRMNPKAITDFQMFGRLDVATNDWTDGIFSSLWRKALKKKGEFIWILLDGPVDAVWIENLNSVLDDNKCLTLANGDRINMSPTCKLVFEVHSLRNASPATVSRCGMIYIGSPALEWQIPVQAWLKARPQNEQAVLGGLVNSTYDQALNYMWLELHPKMTLIKNSYAFTLMNLLNGVIPKTDNTNKTVSNAHLEKLYVFCMFWSLGAVLELDERKKLQVFMLQNCKNLPWPELDPSGTDTIFEFYVDDNGHWAHWKDRVPEWIYPQDRQPDFSSIIIPTVDNVRMEFLMQTIANQGRPVLLIGEPGTAKTVTVQRFLQKLNPEVQLSKSLNFSSATTPNLYQRTIESWVDKRMGTTYGPPAGKKMTVFIDDMNMPEINEWGDQVTSEIVRQLIENQGFYSLDRPGEWTSVVDLLFMGAMMHPGGGRNDIPERLKRHFTVFNCTIPSEVSVDKIFGTILSGHVSSARGFSKDVIDLAAKLPGTTRRLWQLTKNKMLPTPAKFHYIFNLRDLSRIMEGMLKAKSECITDAKLLLNLWEHECSRVLPDRFTNAEDVDWFAKSLVSVVQKEYGDEMASSIANKSFFADFLRDPPENDDPDVEIDPEAYKVYERVGSFETMREKLLDYQRQYNESIRGSKMDLVLFEDAMKHLIRISRILRTPRGNALLVGVGGSGKQSLVKLASFIAKNQTFQISITKNYNTTNLMEDLKYMYKIAGVNGKPVTFIFTDNEIKDESFLGYINNILTSGEVTGLFPKDEVISIAGDLRNAMKKARPGVVDTIENLWKFFIDRVKDNLHVVLCFSPVGEKFRNRALKFPGLVSGCTMDWFTRWPNEALRAVADKFLMSMDISCTAETKKETIAHMAFVHDCVTETCTKYFGQFRRNTHVTPKSYLSFLGSYKALYGVKLAEVGLLAERMNTGLKKLAEASESVAQLQKELVVKEKDLAVASKEADAVLAEVTASTTEAEKVKDAVLKVKTKAEAIATTIMADKTVAEGQLEEAKPALAEAEAALNSIQPAHIATIRKLAKPPHLIMRIMDGVLLLLKKKIDTVTPDPERPCPKPSWSESMRLMSQSDFLTSLLTFAKDEINAETVDLLEPYLEQPDFNLEGAKKVSADVAGLASWVRAMAYFYTINKKVIPLKANLIIQERRLEIANTDLAKAQAQLDEKEAELNVFKAKYDEAIGQKMALQADADGCKRKMAAASALIGGLKGEKERWTNQSKEFADRINRLVGDVILACAFLSYSGPFNQTFRTALINDWQSELVKRRIPFSENLDIIAMLADATTIGEWNIQGLPTDELSTQNGIIVTRGTRYPLLIDPQNQAKTWIRNREEQNKLVVTSLSHKYFRQHIEDAVTQGRPLLIEDVEEQLDPTLDNILEKNWIKSGRGFKVIFGDKELDIAEGFTMYITTKLPNPTYTPEIYAKTSIIDFTVTQKGLEDQLLGRVILREKQELEIERVKLMEEVNTNKKKMKKLEDDLLERLTSTQGSLVDDESLIEVLATTKTTSEEVNEKLAIAAETGKKITGAREEYRPVAARGSVIYFLIAEMSMVNVMYQTSLKQFLKLFDESMDKSAASPIPAKRIQNIIDYCTFRSFGYIVRGLYDEHKVMFVLLLAVKIDLLAGKVSHEEFRAFISGGAALDINNVTKKPAAWLSDITWLNLAALAKIPIYQDLLGHIAKNEKAWRVWYEKDSPETEEMPGGYDAQMDAFRRLLLIRAWTLDRTIMSAKTYIAQSLGAKFAESQILDLEAILSESDHRTPLVALLSTGADPSADIENLAKKSKVEIKNISMGQGQEVHARKLIQTFMATGGWALLQNCHLGIPFLDELQTMLLDTEQIHDKFRLWITTDVTVKFPINLLQMSIKFTNEPPQGLRAGLKRTYNWISQDMLDMSNRPQYKSMLYGVSFLHSIVQERRKFGPLGWNIPYEFNQSDLAASVQFVQNHIDELQPKAPISWTTVRYMFCEVHYGGRVTDDFDRRLLTTYGRSWFGDHMFADNFNFYKGYPIPNMATIDEYRHFIESLPLIDTPEVFGLHPNADISCMTKVSQKMLDTTLSIQPKDSSTGSGETREDVVKRLANDLLSKLPQDFDKHWVKECIRKQGGPKPLNIFLGQEVDRMQAVIKITRADLQDLKLAIDGTIIMSASLQAALDALYDARVPATWAKISWQSMTLGLWFSELIARVQQFQSWLSEGRPLVYWLPGFFNPQGFLTAIRQEITRAHNGWALDNVKLTTEVMKQMKEDVTTPPTEGVYIHGLFVEGAGWDRKNMRLTESQAKILYQAMPVIHVSAINSSEDEDPKLYVCPVYKRPRRTDQNYIFNVTMKTTQSPDYWAMRGVCLLGSQT